MINFFKVVIYVPLYNILIAILNISWIDAGVAAIILTIIVKLLLYPIAKKAIVTQIRMKDKEKDLALIKEKYKDPQEQALKVMEFYKENKINPFSGIVTLIIQIPIIYSLYYIFLKSGLPSIDTSMLYSFVKAPASVSVNFLGIVDVSQKSIVLALLAAISSFYQMHLSAPATTGGKEDFSVILAKQMKFTMPVIVFFVAWRISGVVAIYWFVSNVVGILQDLYVKKRLGLASAK